MKKSSKARLIKGFRNGETTTFIRNYFKLKGMKEQIAILPPMPIVGTLKLTSLDGESLHQIEVIKSPHKIDRINLSPFFKNCFQELQAYLDGKSKQIEITADITSLSPFQKAVLEVMAKIPYGKKQSYKELAESLNTKAYQAVGAACGKNPLLLIYPCHRVIGSKGPGGFAHGLDMKRKLWQLEGQD